MLPSETLIPLLLLSALLLVFALHTLAASGQFPREHRTPALATALGVIVLYGTIAVTMASLVVALLAAWRRIPWYAAVLPAVSPFLRRRSCCSSFRTTSSTAAPRC
jgi:hypothetical protein